VSVSFLFFCLWAIVGLSLFGAFSLVSKQVKTLHGREWEKKSKRKRENKVNHKKEKKRVKKKEKKQGKEGFFRRVCDDTKKRKDYFFLSFLLF